MSREDEKVAAMDLASLHSDELLNDAPYDSDDDLVDPEDLELNEYEEDFEDD